MNTHATYRHAEPRVPSHAAGPVTPPPTIGPETLPVIVTMLGIVGLVVIGAPLA